MFDVMSSVPSDLASVRDRVLGFLPDFASLRFCVRARRALEIPGPRSAGIGFGFAFHGSCGAVGFGSHAAVHRAVRSGLRGRLRLQDETIIHAEVESLRKTSGTEQRGQGKHCVFQAAHLGSPFSRRSQRTRNTRAIRICSCRIRQLACWWKKARAEKCRRGTTQQCSELTTRLISQPLDLSQRRDISTQTKSGYGYTCPLPHRCRLGFVMTVITQEDLVQSVADALQYISYYHPRDYIQHLARAYEREQSPAAKDAIAQILSNSRQCAEGRRPVCQDTGIVNVFLKIGMGVRLDGFEGSSFPSVTDAVNEGVRRAYLHPDNKLRASIVEDPVFGRRNTKDNTPAVIHMEIVPGNRVAVDVAAKGAGSENKSKFAMLNPSDSIVDWVLKTVPTMGAGWCPPGMLGIGVGGTAEKAMMMAKESLMEPIDMHELLARGPRDAHEELRLALYEKVNQLGIGAQGLGGLSTVLDVKIRTFPTHAGSQPIAMIPNCAATRHLHFALDGSGPAEFEAPSLEDWPNVTWTPAAQSRRVNLDTLTRAEVTKWKPGETLLLSGKLVTGRDAAHKRIADMLAKGEKLPVDFSNRVIYYVGPVDPVRDEVVGPAGPTTATRMDKFTEMMLGQTGLIAMIGKGERGPAAVETIRKHKAASLIAVGGAAYLVAKAIRKSRVLAFGDLGMEAIYEFEVKDMPVTVAVDANGTSVHQTGPAEWEKRIKDFKIPVAVA